ncbi:hypothetical protein F3Y22_tig00112857pilonHSYRG00011 [Hibiscus syriacus]|uniref:Uncharacterized protein n=1 Tax=Hibiscus syriacus TaxID=106335 RepID=A0A6A2Y574_HIBSY|nr:hypothetical protein F3Y22_tig00112857pilonHSYRG00011 [Hibiscus syriacus]
MCPQGQQPMLLSDNCLKPFEGPSSSYKDYYLQDFDHLDHDHVNGSSSSNPVFLYDAFPCGCSANNVDFYESKPLAAVGHAQVMDNLGKKRVLAYWKGLRKSTGVKGQWTMEEDRVLIQLVEQYGDTWSEEEYKVRIQAHMEIGNKWAEIAKRFPGRTENSIKNHWNAAKRRQFSKRKCRSRGLNLESTTEEVRTTQTTDRLVPQYEFSFDEKMLQDSCTNDFLLHQIPTADQELDLVEMISPHPQF